MRFFRTIQCWPSRSIKKWEPWFSVFLEKFEDLSTLGPYYGTAVIWSRSVLTHLGRCVLHSLHHTLQSHASLLHSFIWSSCPWKHLIRCLQIYTICSSAGERGWVIGRWRSLRNAWPQCAFTKRILKLSVFLCVPQLSEKIYHFLWKRVPLLETDHQLALHISYDTIKHLPSINILGCYVIEALK